MKGQGNEKDKDKDKGHHLDVIGLLDLRPLIVELGRTQSELIWAIWCAESALQSHSELIRAIALEDSPCCGGPAPGVSCRPHTRTWPGRRPDRPRRTRPCLTEQKRPAISYESALTRACACRHIGTHTTRTRSTRQTPDTNKQTRGHADTHMQHKSRGGLRFVVHQAGRAAGTSPPRARGAGSY